MALIQFVLFHPWRTAVILIVGALLGTAAFYVYVLSTALGAVATEDFDPNAARAAIAAAPAVEEPTPTSIWNLEVEEVAEGVFGDPLAEIEATYGASVSPEQRYPTAFGEPIADSEFDSYLLVGTDASSYLADAIVLGLQPAGGGAPIMVSLPRDLYVWNLCKGRFTKLNAGLGGCKGMASGSELLAMMVEDYTGIPVDHLARINFDGFARLVNAMGGITVCVDLPTRDAKANLEISEPGCQVVDGDTALAWVRSRSPEQLQGEEWVRVGGSDFTRQQRQQDVLFQLAGKAANFSSPASLTTKLSAVASSVRLDSSWSFGSAINTGWKYRGISTSSVKRFSIGVRDYRTSFGEAVLVSRQKFTEQLATVWSG
ncbi:MAG: LCP family protein [Actinomycetota bacterium]|nr:LCP family protein [Actinomycetota bacterium]